MARFLPVLSCSRSTFSVWLHRNVITQNALFRASNFQLLLNNLHHGRNVYLWWHRCRRKLAASPFHVLSFFFCMGFIWRPVSAQISLSIMCCSFQQSEQPDNFSVLWIYSAKCLCAYIITFMAEKQVVSQKTLEVFYYTPAYKNRVCLHEVAVYLRLIHATLVPYSFSFFTPFIALSL